MSASDNGSPERSFEPSSEQKGWRFGKRDAFFLAFVAAVVVALVLGTSERTTKPTPNDDVHQKAITVAACMECHDSNGVKPYPARHVQGGQCFQCHVQPENWVGAK